MPKPGTGAMINWVPREDRLCPFTCRKCNKIYNSIDLIHSARYGTSSLLIKGPQVAGAADRWSR